MAKPLVENRDHDQITTISLSDASAPDVDWKIQIHPIGHNLSRADLPPGCNDALYLTAQDPLGRRQTLQLSVENGYPVLWADQRPLDRPIAVNAILTEDGIQMAQRQPLTATRNLSHVTFGQAGMEIQTAPVGASITPSENRSHFADIAFPTDFIDRNAEHAGFLLNGGEASDHPWPIKVEIFGGARASAIGLVMATPQEQPYMLKLAIDDGNLTVGFQHDRPPPARRGFEPQAVMTLAPDGIHVSSGYEGFKPKRHMLFTETGPVISEAGIPSGHGPQAPTKILVTRSEVADGIENFKRGYEPTTAGGRMLIHFHLAITQREWTRPEIGRPTQTGRLVDGIAAIENALSTFKAAKNLAFELDPKFSRAFFSIASEANKASFARAAKAAEALIETAAERRFALAR